jgi:hypothetical protein
MDPLAHTQPGEAQDTLHLRRRLHNVNRSAAAYLASHVINGADSCAIQIRDFAEIEGYPPDTGLERISKGGSQLVGVCMVDVALDRQASLAFPMHNGNPHHSP